MIYEKTIYGKNIHMRSVTEEDATFLLEIRSDEKKNKYVHAVDNDLDKEVQWIKNQKEKDADYFFSIIKNDNDELIGNVAIYNVDEKEKSAELGRWVSYGSAMDNLESIILTHDFAFNCLGLETIYSKTLQENTKVVSFWKRFGGIAEENKQFEELVVYYNIVRKEQYFNEIRNKFIRYVEG